MHSIASLYTLLLAMTACAHPPVSNPHQSVDFNQEVVFEAKPGEVPLHTTVLMAQASALANVGVGSGSEGGSEDSTEAELKI